jgi:hypothetical protein
VTPTDNKQQLYSYQISINKNTTALKKSQSCKCLKNDIGVVAFLLSHEPAKNAYINQYKKECLIHLKPIVLNQKYLHTYMKSIVLSQKYKFCILTSNCRRFVDKPSILIFISK